MFQALVCLKNASLGPCRDAFFAIVYHERHISVPLVYLPKSGQLTLRTNLNEISYANKRLSGDLWRKRRARCVALVDYTAFDCR